MSRFGAFPRTPALRSGCSGASLVGGRKESFPQLRSPPRSGLLEYSVLYCVYLLLSFCGFVVCAFGVHPRTTPILVFIREYVVSLPLLNFCGFGVRRRSSFSPGRS